MRRWKISFNSIRRLPVELEHCAQVATLPFHHRDPFDRMLVSQTICDDMALATADRTLNAYGIDVIW